MLHIYVLATVKALVSEKTRNSKKVVVSRLWSLTRMSSHTV